MHCVSRCCTCSAPLSYGPRASKKFSTPFSERGQFVVDFKYAPFAQAARRASHGGNSSATKRAAVLRLESEEKSITQQLHEAVSVSIHLEAFPKTVLEAYVLVLQDGGGVLSSAVAAISLALADAGVMVYDMVAACEATEMQRVLYLDPTTEEAEKNLEAQHAHTNDDEEEDAMGVRAASSAASQLMVTYMPSLRQITSITQTGTSTPHQLKQLTQLCIAGCEQMNGLMRECLVEAAKKKAVA
jgi:exosome complex component MTR3